MTTTDEAPKLDLGPYATHFQAEAAYASTGFDNRFLLLIEAGAAIERTGWDVAVLAELSKMPPAEVMAIAGMMRRLYLQGLRRGQAYGQAAADLVAESERFDSSWIGEGARMVAATVADV